MIQEFLDENLDKIKQEPVTVNIMSASWCAPCKSLKIIMDKLSEEYKDRAVFLKGDVEEGAINFASSIGVRGVPTMTVMKKGVEIDRIVGNPGEAKLKEFLDKNI
ncbi:thioredoxin family protein [Pelagibacterales bacterium SAG-MED24]|nr:thioredoxin family protein [Pelagibacterales bacterium SAG-MED24]